MSHEPCHRGHRDLPLAHNQGARVQEPCQPLLGNRFGLTIEQLTPGDWCSWRTRARAHMHMHMHARAHARARARCAINRYTFRIRALSAFGAGAYSKSTRQVQASLPLGPQYREDYWRASRARAVPAAALPAPTQRLSAVSAEVGNLGV